MDFTILKLERKDLQLAKDLFMLFDKIFQEEGQANATLPNDNYLNKLLAQTSFHVFVALSDGKVIGGLTAYELTMYMKMEKEMYLYDLGVSDDFRRKGVASKLIKELKKYARDNNISTIFVEANEEDAGAVEFYKSLGAEMENVKHFNISSKDLD